VMSLHNLADKTCTVRINREPDSALLCLLSSGSENELNGPTIRMESYGYRWYRVLPNQR
jgi:hypothetical protein